jgi:hypothetical protein
MTTLGIVCSMTNVFAAEQVCSINNVTKDISPTGEFSYENLTGDTPEAVMAQLKPFYKKYNERTISNPDPYSDVYGYTYHLWSANYTFIGFNNIRNNIAYYDVNSQFTDCTHLEIINSKPPTPPTDSCFSSGGIYPSIQCKPATCPAPVNGQRAAADCTQTVSLTPVSGQTEPRPNGSEGDGKSTYDLIAKVTEGNQPKAGMALTFTVEVEAGSGGIPTIPTGRPTGNLNIKSGTTNASGEVKVTFTSPIFAGRHTVTVTCAKCTGTKKDDIETFNVKVPGLSLFSADTKVPARWKFVGTDNYHYQERFYLTKTASDNLRLLINAMQLIKSDKTGQTWGVAELNDASLPWGGKYNGYNSKNPQPYHWETTWNRD